MVFCNRYLYFNNKCSHITNQFSVVLLQKINILLIGFTKCLHKNKITTSYNSKYYCNMVLE